MIVPMKKISIMVLDRERGSALEGIRELGVLHIEKKTASSVSINRLLSRKSKIESAISILQNCAALKKQKKSDDPAFIDNVKDYTYNLVDRIMLLDEKRRSLQDWIHTNNRELRLYNNWGSFNPADLDFLADAGITLTPYIMSLEVYNEIPADRKVIVLNIDNKTVSLVSVNCELPGLTPQDMPQHPADKLRAMNEIKVPQIAEIEQELFWLTTQEKRLVTELKQTIQRIEFETTKLAMEKVDFNEELDLSHVPVDFSVSYINGYVPAPEMERIAKAAKQNNWAFIADDPEEDDLEVPTLLKNNKAASLIYPLTEFLDMMPGYHEIDISGWFLFFFTIFFGMLFGDAAYGAILFIIALTGIVATSKNGTPQFFKMLLLLSISNIAWGVLTCSWFAMPTEKVPEVLRNISLGLISTAKSAETGYTEVDVKNHLIVFCFCLALLQLSIAHIIGIFRYIKSLKFLAEVASLLMLVGMFDVVLWLVIGKDYEAFQLLNPEWGITQALYLLIAGFGLNFIFSGYDSKLAKSVIGNIGYSLLSSVKNIISVVLGITNVFSDIMSYIRLWAVGLAGASIASTVNGMASGMLGGTAGPVVAQLLMFAGLVLLCFGHSFNMVLNVLAVLVHGVRLNTLEFSGHLGLTWSGFAYKPFKVTAPEKK
ncbi:MAG: V-type ATP synthase subunit I [Termitinemataceae bacterium]|nr:MAG: V-type ATP synthase subunit I [Termitinemataceae bacterium]